MREQLAGAVVCLGGGVLFAWLMCALAQMAALAPAWARRVPVPTRRKPGCARDDRERRGPGVVAAVCFACLLIVPPGLLAVGIARTCVAVTAAQVGVLAGWWLSRRWGMAERVRTIAVTGCLVGAAALGGGFGCFLAGAAEAGLDLRMALDLAVATGALLLGASASALGGVSHAGPREPFTTGDRLIHAAALVLCVALGCRFVAAGTSREFGLSVLVATGLLGLALGAQLMTGARRRRAVSPLARFAGAPHSAGGCTGASALPLRPCFAGVPDELLVEACGSGSFAPGCLYAHDASFDGAVRAVHHVARDRPRRRRIRRLAPRQEGRN